MLGRTELHFNFSDLLRVGLNVHRFPSDHMIKSHCLLESLEYIFSNIFSRRPHNIIQLELTEMLKTVRILKTSCRETKVHHAHTKMECHKWICPTFVGHNLDLGYNITDD